LKIGLGLSHGSSTTVANDGGFFDGAKGSITYTCRYGKIESSNEICSINPTDTQCIGIPIDIPGDVPGDIPVGIDSCLERGAIVSPGLCCYTEFRDWGDGIVPENKICFELE
jgi:hypothetical protein